VLRRCSGTYSKENQDYYNLEEFYSKNSYVSEDLFNLLISNKFSDNQLKAYIGCLDLCKSIANKELGLYYIVCGDLTDILSVTVGLDAQDGGAKITLKGDASFTNLEPIGKLLFKDSLIIKNKASVTQQFKRVDPLKSAQFSIYIHEQYPVTPKDFPGQPKVNTQALPIGTIVASVLEYDKFLSVNGYKNTGNLKEVIWTPCDGRNVSESKYASLGLGFTKVPDLRGVFLRNVNDYKIPGAGEINPSQLNPDNTIKAGDFQNDTLKSHTHKYDNSYSGRIVRAEEDGGGGRTNANPGQNTEPYGGQETRPKNVTVYYYIKIND
jgi:hypothetical protein